MLSLLSLNKGTCVLQQVSLSVNKRWNTVTASQMNQHHHLKYQDEHFIVMFICSLDLISKSEESQLHSRERESSPQDGTPLCFCFIIKAFGLSGTFFVCGLSLPRWAPSKMEPGF